MYGAGVWASLALMCASVLSGSVLDLVFDLAMASVAAGEVPIHHLWADSPLLSLTCLEKALLPAGVWGRSVRTNGADVCFSAVRVHHGPGI